MKDHLPDDLGDRAEQLDPIFEAAAAIPSTTIKCASGCGTQVHKSGLLCRPCHQSRYHRMPARYSGTCAGCGRRFGTGDAILYDTKGERGKRGYHPGCERA